MNDVIGFKAYDTVYIELHDGITNAKYTNIKRILEKAEKYFANIVMIHNGKEMENFIIKGYSNFFCIDIRTKEMKYGEYGKKSQILNEIERNNIIKEIRKITRADNILYVNEFIQKYGLEEIKLLKFVPVITEKKSTKDEYALELAKYISSKKNNNFFEGYIKKFNKKFDFKIYSFNEIFDRYTGGISFEDSEILLLKEKDSKHMLFSLFEVEVFNNQLKYAYNERNKIILRGPNNYYFNMCYVEHYTKEEMKTISNMVIEFLNKCLNTLHLKNIDIYSKIEDLKCILAILDIIRNITTIELYYLVKKQKQDESLLIIYNDIEKDTLIYKCYKTLETAYKTIYALLFEKEKIEYISKIERLIKETIEIEKEVQKEKDKLLSVRTIRMWRETDFIIENILNIEKSLKELKNEYIGINEKKNYILGANYGSIDLAVLTGVIAQKLDYEKIETGIIILKASYQDIYANEKIDVTCASNFKSNEPISEFECILIDDNIVSGKSFETAVHIIAQKLNTPLCGIVIRPPQINRVNQMFTERNNSRIKIDLFDRYIKGLDGTCFFSKLCDREKNESLLDTLGVFDEVKERVRREMFKNRLYNPKSYVGTFGNGI